MSVLAISAQAWQCRANSGSGGWGIGLSNNLYNAKIIALNECSMRTPNWDICYITSCW